MTALPPDPYRILGVSKDAQLNEIRAAHRKLVLKCHPDKVQDPTLKAAKQDEFQKVQQAYELLSDENERAKYDDNVKLAELRKEMAAKGMSANTSAPRAPSARTYDVNIRTAEPRADTFKTTSTYRSSPGTKMYSQYPSRSWDEEIHRSSPIFEEPRARRAASYEKPSRQEEERDRERERRRRKEEDRERERDEAIRAVERRERERIAIERERERIAEKKAADKAAEKAARKAAEKAAEEKEMRRRERKAFEKAEKEREKERKLAAEDKSRRHKTATAYVEPYGDDETYLAKTDKKKSSSSKKSKEEEKRSRSIPREAPREEAAPPPTPAVPVDLTKLKYAETMLSAASYMDKARKGAPGLNRAQTFAEGSRFEPPVAAPTPPAAAPFAPPPPPPVPTAEEDVRRSKSRRSSETKRDKSSHKKSPTKDQQSPYVVEASPTARPMPQFASTHSSPVGASSPPKHLGRSSTFNDGYVRPPPGPARAQTFHYGIETDSRGRNRSRLQPQVSEDSDSEDDPRPPRRSHRHKMEEAIPLDYNQPRSTRYAVSGTRTIPVESGHSSYYRDESPTRKVYYMERPPLARESSNYSSSAFGQKVKTSRGYTHEDVQYSNIPHRYRDPEYAY